jgi:hypothetical protein
VSKGFLVGFMGPLPLHTRACVYAVPGYSNPSGMWILRQCEVSVCMSVTRRADGNLYLSIC